MLSDYFDAGYPLLFVETFDEQKLHNKINESDRELFIYSATGDMVDEKGNREPLESFPKAFQFAAEQANAVVVIRDVQSLIANAAMYRPLLNACDSAKQNGTCIICVAPAWKLPMELQHAAPVIAVELPTRRELEPTLAGVIDDIQLQYDDLPDVDIEQKEKLLDAAAGLTFAEAENAFALSVANTGKFSHDVVAREKMRILGATGFLAVEQPMSMNQVGGLELLKTYISDEVTPCLRNPKLAVRGIILAGLPGTGKSLASKAFGATFDWPIIRFDVPATKAGIVGQSEANIRRATSLIEAVAPCVLWIDEVEKAIGGSSGAAAASDGGTSLGMLGHLLTWLQEHNKRIFTVATCNDYGSLPGAFTRCGRFDERFYVDLPNDLERIAIAEVHLRRLDCNVSLAETIAERTDCYTGAEIEQLIKSAARLTSCQIDDAAITRAAKSIRPVAKVDAERTDAIRAKYSQLLRPANEPIKEKPHTNKPKRSIRKRKGDERHPVQM